MMFSTPTESIALNGKATSKRMRHANSLFHRLRLRQYEMNGMNERYHLYIMMLMLFYLFFSFNLNMFFVSSSYIRYVHTYAQLVNHIQILH